MTVSQIGTLFKPEIERDQYGRPKIWTKPHEHKPTGCRVCVPYTRVSTMAKALSNEHALTEWKKRQVAVGLSLRADLLAMVATHRDDRDQVQRAADDAMEAAASASGANMGTALHKYAEQWDTNTLAIETVLPGLRPDVEAYAQRIEPFRVVSVEQFVVIDSLLVAGSFDRLLECPDWLYTPDGQPAGVVVSDIKTGQHEPDYPHNATVQTALYANGTGYRVGHADGDPRTVNLIKAGVNPNWSLLIHLPFGQGRCDLYWLDIATGWTMAKVAVGVRAWLKSNPITQVDTQDSRPTTAG